MLPESPEEAARGKVINSNSNMNRGGGDYSDGNSNSNSNSNGHCRGDAGNMMMVRPRCGTERRPLCYTDSNSNSNGDGYTY